MASLSVWYETVTVYFHPLWKLINVALQVNFLILHLRKLVQRAHLEGLHKAISKSRSFSLQVAQLLYRV